MIARYTRPELEAIWSEDQRYALWMRIEVAVCRALARRGEIPRDAFAVIEQRAEVDPARVAEIEARVQHDVNAFLDALGRADRAGVALRAPRAHVLGRARHRARHAARRRGSISSSRSAIARSPRSPPRARAQRHGLRGPHARHVRRADHVRAEAAATRTTRCGATAAGWRARRAVAVGKISGAVGTFAHLSPEVEVEALAELGLEPASVSTQIVCRDRHAELFTRAGADRELGRAARDRDAPPGAQRGRRGPGVLRRRAEGQLGDAAQAQPWRFETLSGSRAWCAATRARRSRTSCSGTSATSRTAPSSASWRRTRRRSCTSCSTGSRR